jgi:hypothetical protein
LVVLADLQRLSQELSRAQFATRWENPFLVFGDIDPESEFEFETRAIDFVGPKAKRHDSKVRTLTPFDSAVVAEGGSRAGVFPVVKSEHNPYAERISIGRGSSCDIVLPDGHVSKLHAHFLRGDGGAWELRDAESTNGTFRNGARIPMGERTPVLFGDRLRFAFLETQFVDAGGLYDLLRRR